MRSAVKVYAAFATAAARNTALSRIQSDYTGLLSIGDDEATGTLEDGRAFLVVVRRLITILDQVLLRDRVLAREAQLPVGLVLQIHDCFHDETPVKACVITAEWRRDAGGFTRTI